MSLTVFLAICILGCDVLIYFLYEWAFGESERIRKGHARSRLAAPSTEAAHSQPSPNTRKAPGATVIAMPPRPPKPASTPVHSQHDERLAYHRIAAASHPPIKRRA